MMTSLILATVLSGLSPIKPPEYPIVRVGYGLERDVIFVSSSFSILNIEIENVEGSFSYFVEYGPMRKQAAIILRTEVDPLHLKIELGIDFPWEIHRCEIANLDAED